MKMKTDSMGTKVMDPACANKCMYRGLGLLVLRLAFVLLMLHGIMKFTDIGGTAKFFGMIGVPMPGVAAYASAIAETLGGLLLAVGLFTEYAGPVVAFNMLVAILTVHLPDALKTGLPMGALKLELPFLYLAAAVALWLCGPGRYSLKRCLGWGCQKKC